MAHCDTFELQMNFHMNFQLVILLEIEQMESRQISEISLDISAVTCTLEKGLQAFLLQLFTLVNSSYGRIR